MNTDSIPDLTGSRRISLALLDPSKTNPREHFDPSYITDLAENFIKHTHPERGIHGIKQSLLVRPRPGGRFEIVCGECRFRGDTEAIKIATERNQPEIAKLLQNVPCRVEDLSDREVIEIQLIENLKREGLRPVEEAKGYKRLLDLREDGGEASYTVAKISEQVGKSERSIYERLKLLDAPEALLKALDHAESGIKAQHCVLIAGIPDKHLREEAAEKVLKGQREWSDFARENYQRPMTVREVKEMIRTEYVVTLKGAPWKLKDGDLLPEAGPCDGCKYLAREFLRDSGELAASGGQTGGGKAGIDPLSCCNPACRDRKMKAYFDTEAKAAKAAGNKVMTASEVKANFHPNGALQINSEFVPVEAKPGHEVTGHFDEKRTPTFEQIAEKAGVKPVLHYALSPANEVVRLIKKSEALTLAQTLKASGPLKVTAKKPVLTEAQKKFKEQEARKNKIAGQVKVEALAMVYDKVVNVGVGLDEQYALLELALMQIGLDGCRLVGEWLAVKPEKPKKHEYDQTKLWRAAILDNLRANATPLPILRGIETAARLAKEVKQYSWAPLTWETVAGAYGLKKGDVEKRATEIVDKEAAEKQAKKKARNEPPPSKPKMVSKSASAARNASIISADEKTRDKLSGGKLSGTLDHCYQDTTVEAFAKRLMEVEVKKSEPNEHGVFCDAVLCKLRVGPSVVGIRLARSTDDRWSAGNEYDSTKGANVSGGGLPNVKGLVKSREAVVLAELTSLTEILPDEYLTAIERLKDTRAAIEKLQAAAKPKPDNAPVDADVKARALEIYKATRSLVKAAEGSGAKLDAVRNWKRRDPAWK